MNINKTFTQEFTPAFLKNEHKQDCHNSCVSPGRTPPKMLDKSGRGTNRTPVKYKTITETTKTSGMSRGSPDASTRSKFKSLN